MRAMGTLHFWIEISAKIKIYNSSFKKNIEIAIEAPKKEKSAGIDDIPAEFVQTGV